MTTEETEIPVVTRGRGYQIAAVDDFLTKARVSLLYNDAELTSSDIRNVAFPLTRQGYDMPSVDQELDRLEEAFAKRERALAVKREGSDHWQQNVRERSAEILERLRRKPKHRFKRTGVLTFGYRVAEVDAVADRIVSFLAEGVPLEAEQLRKVAFRMQRRGYREAQVDAVLNATIDVILAVRAEVGNQ
jgi:DivIVA domain-containing protein